MLPEARIALGISGFVPLHALSSKLLLLGQSNGHASAAKACQASGFASKFIGPFVRAVF